MTIALRSLVAAAALLALPTLVSAATPEETCDRIAAHPFDRDRPAEIKGRLDIDKTDIAPGIEACTAAIAKPNAPRRFTFQRGRLHEHAGTHAKAAQDYKSAADAGSTSAMVGLGMLTINGKGVKHSKDEARKLFEKAANDGDVVAMGNLGSIYGGGIGVRADFAKARAWFTKAANANYSEAMFQFGLMTQDGDGARKDVPGAKTWFEKAAALEHAGAIYMLGSYAEEGKAGPRDQKAAVEHYRKAAALGDEDAIDALKRLRCPFSLTDEKGNAAGKICFAGN